MPLAIVLRYFHRTVQLHQGGHVGCLDMEEGSGGQDRTELPNESHF